MTSSDPRETGTRRLQALMIIERYLPIWGGAEIQLRQLASRLVKKDTGVEIVTRRWSRDLARREEIDGITVHRVGWPGSSPVATLGFIAHLALWTLRHKGRFSVFHAHGAVKLGALTSALARISGRPSVAKIATAGHLDTFAKGGAGGLVLRLFARTDAIISMTDEIDGELEAAGIPKDRAVRIENGVDPDRFRPASAEDRAAWRQRQGLSPDAIVAVFSGRLVHRKGLDVLVRAWDGRDRDTGEAHLFIMGSGDTQPDSIETDLRRALDDGTLADVTLAGFVEAPEEYLNHADIFVFPSRREGYPNAVLEAMSAGLAVAASRIGGCTDMIDDSETGLLTEAGDAPALAAALDRLIGDGALRQRLQNTARAQVEAVSSIDRVADKYRALYARLAA